LRRPFPPPGASAPPPSVSAGPPLQDKTRHLKHTLNAQFRMIHELCTFVLLNTRKESLVHATLTALHAYLSWVPVG
jgi:exportin-1